MSSYPLHKTIKECKDLGASITVEAVEGHSLFLLIVRVTLPGCELLIVARQCVFQSVCGLEVGWWHPEK